MPNISPSRLFLGGAISVGGLTAATLFLARQRLESCRRVPLSSLPQSSTCRNFVQHSTSAITPTSPKAWGLNQTRLLPAWPPGDDIAATTHWIPSFFAVQMDLSDAILTTKSKVLSMDGDVLPLATSLPAAFLHARAAGPEQFILDRDVPPLDSRSDGIPKLAKGAFQELMVETVADGHVRVSYVSAEVSTCWQAVRREQERGLTRLSRFLYELHVMYAQSLLAGAARQLIIMTSFSRPPRSDASRLRGATADLIWPLTTSSLSTLRSHPSLQPPPPPSPSSQLIEPAHHGISLPRAPPR